MHVRALFIVQAALFLLLAGLFSAGLYFYLQWLWWWYDIVLHLLGGVWVALVLMWLAMVSRQVPRIVPVLLGVLVVGVLWELFEVVVGMPRAANYTFDTSLDILNDVLGSIVGFFLGHTMIRGMSVEVIE